jgi:hypothetical protein
MANSLATAAIINPGQCAKLNTEAKLGFQR